MMQEKEHRDGRTAMAWMILIAAGLMEAVWAVSLQRSEGFTKLIPSIVFAFALALSMLGLAFALKSLPLGTAYSVWVGIGAAATVIYGMASGSEPVSIARILLIVGLIGCVIGLKLVGSDEQIVTP